MATLTGAPHCLVPARRRAARHLHLLLPTTDGRHVQSGHLPQSIADALGCRHLTTPTTWLLTLTSALTQLSGLNINQTSVANALDKAFNSWRAGTAVFAALFGLPATAVPFALTQLSGEIGTGAPTAASRRSTSSST